jgi:ribosomal RNA methyltransferase Nop2
MHECCCKPKFELSLLTLQELAEEQQGAPPLPKIQARIRDVVRVLSNFKVLRQPDVPRSDYVARLAADLAAYYGYNEFLLDSFLQMFPVAEALEFLEANEKPRPVTLRTNTLKVTGRRELGPGPCRHRVCRVVCGMLQNTSVLISS